VATIIGNGLSFHRFLDGLKNAKELIIRLF